MFERFTERARQAVVAAQAEARSLEHDFLGTEHLLLGLLRVEDGFAAHILTSLGVEIGAVRARVIEELGRGDEAPRGQIPFTPRAKKVLELSLREAISLGHNYVGTEHILLGLVRENDGVAARILLEFDLDADTLRAEAVDLLSERATRAASEGSPGQLPWRAARRVGSPRIPRFEYLVEEQAETAAEVLQERLGELGRQGWELTAVLPTDAGARWIFKRLVPPRAMPVPGAGAGLGERLLGARWSGGRTAPRTVEELVDTLARAKERAVQGEDPARAEAIGELEQQLAGLLAQMASTIDAEGGSLPGSMRLDELVRALAGARRRRFDVGFEHARAAREFEREFVRLLRSIGEAIGGEEPPAAKSG